MTTMKRLNFFENKIYDIDILKTQGLDSILVFLRENNIIKQINNQFQFVFIGSIYIKDFHILVHPKYRTKPYTEQEIEIFHKSLIKFQHTVSLLEENYDIAWKDIYSVLRDFEINGLFKSYHKVYQNNWSNPSWEKMFQVSPCYINHIPYWEKPISNVTVISSEQIKELHIHMIQYLLQKFPAIKSLFPYLNIPVPSNPIDVTLLKHRIQLELQKTLFSREQNIMKLVLKIINSQSASEGLIIGTKHSHVFWEQLCKNYLNDVSYKWIEQFPRAHWSIKEKEGQTFPHRPDIILEKEDSIYLYDAKYYNTDYHQPGIQDITKQILYERCIKSIKPDATIHNGFIFPSENPEDHFTNISGKITYNIFGIDTSIKTHHQYDIEIFKSFQ